MLTAAFSNLKQVNLQGLLAFSSPPYFQAVLPYLSQPAKCSSFPRPLTPGNGRTATLVSLKTALVAPFRGRKGRELQMNNNHP